MSKNGKVATHTHDSYEGSMQVNSEMKSINVIAIWSLRSHVSLVLIDFYILAKNSDEHFLLYGMQGKIFTIYMLFQVHIYIG